MDYRSKRLLSSEEDVFEETVHRYKDERDTIQKKTFTKWINQHLKKCGRGISDLFENLKDGKNLISLLEVLNAIELPHQHGHMRFHMIQNVQIVLNYLNYNNIKLVNIRAEDIVDGNPKLTLGLIWTIILHFQISDVVETNDGKSTVKETLLRWAQRSVDGYPNVSVANFTTCWRDGLVFNALIHRNRPDLLDWAHTVQMSPHSRLEQAFRLAETQLNVARLLDPEDVDRKDVDDKSIITYISYLYDIFPSPPALNPLNKQTACTLLDKYRRTATCLHDWMRFHERRLTQTIRELQQKQQTAAAATTSSSCVMSESYVASRLSEFETWRNDEFFVKQRLQCELVHEYNYIEENYGGSIPDLISGLAPELRVSCIQHDWLALCQCCERLQCLLCELAECSARTRAEQLTSHVLAARASCERRLHSLETRVHELLETIVRVSTGHLQREHDVMKQELISVQESISDMSESVSLLKKSKDERWQSLSSEVSCVSDRCSCLLTCLQEKIYTELCARINESGDDMLKRLLKVDENFRRLSDACKWVESKLNYLKTVENGHDLESCTLALELAYENHSTYEDFQSTVHACERAHSRYAGSEHSSELALYERLLAQLQSSHGTLLSRSSQRVTDVRELHRYVRDVTEQLLWLSEHEEREVERDWSNRNVDLCAIEELYQQTLSDLECRRTHIRTELDAQADSLISQHHPSADTVKAFRAALHSQCDWLAQLLVCVQSHLSHAQQAQSLFEQLERLTDLFKIEEESLNTKFNRTEFDLDEGETLLKEMQHLRYEMDAQCEHVHRLQAEAELIVPQAIRRRPQRPGEVCLLSLCNYEDTQTKFKPNEHRVLHDNSDPYRWVVSTGEKYAEADSGVSVPSVCLLVTAADPEALAAVAQVHRHHELLVSLWKRKQLRLRQNMIFATIRIVRAWDLQQYMAMAPDQRLAIRQALNEDSVSLSKESDPGDVHMRRMRTEIDEINLLFDQFERLAAESVPLHEFSVIFEQLKTRLVDSDDFLKRLCLSPLPTDSNVAADLIIDHKQWMQQFRQLDEEFEHLRSLLSQISTNSSALKSDVNELCVQWDAIISRSTDYLERCKLLQSILSSVSKSETFVCGIETRLAAFQDLPECKEKIKAVHLSLLNIKNIVEQHQYMITSLDEDLSRLCDAVQKSRENYRLRNRDDIDYFIDVNRDIQSRYEECLKLIVSRLETIDKLSDVMHQYEKQEQFEKEMAMQRQADEDRLRSESRQKYEQVMCLLEQFSEWLQTTEQSLCAHGVSVSENLSVLSASLDTVKEIRDDVRSRQQHLFSISEQLQVLKSYNMESVFSCLEISHITDKHRTATERYESLFEFSDSVGRCLSNCLDELTKYDRDLVNFQAWLQEAESRLGALRDFDSSHLSTDTLCALHSTAAELSNDTVAHQADLRFVIVTAEKFHKDVSVYLSKFDKLSFAVNCCQVDDNGSNIIDSQVDDISKNYSEFATRVSNFYSFVCKLKSAHAKYSDTHTRASSWLQEMVARWQQLSRAHSPTVSVRDCTDGVHKAHMHTVQALHAQLCSPEHALVCAAVDEGRCVQALLAQEALAAESYLTDPECLRLEYERVLCEVQLMCEQLDMCAVTARELSEKTAEMLVWQREYEECVPQPLCVSAEQCERQMQVCARVREAVQQREAFVQSLRQLVTDGEPCEAAEAVRCFERLARDGEQWWQMLSGTRPSLDRFWSLYTPVRAWLDDMCTRLDGGGAQEDCDLRLLMSDKEPQYKSVVESFDAIVALDYVTEYDGIQEKVLNLSESWQNLCRFIDERDNENTKKLQTIEDYTRLYNDICACLARLDKQFYKPFSFELSFPVIKKNLSQLQSLSAEIAECNRLICQLHDLANQYENQLVNSRVSPLSIRTPSSGSAAKRFPVGRSPSKSRSSNSLDLNGEHNGGPMLYSRSSSAPNGDVNQMQSRLCEIDGAYERLLSECEQRHTVVTHAHTTLQEMTSLLDQVSDVLAEFCLSCDTPPCQQWTVDRCVSHITQHLEAVQQVSVRMRGKRHLVDTVQELQQEVMDSVHVTCPAALSSRVQRVVAEWTQSVDVLRVSQHCFQEMIEMYENDAHLCSWLQHKQKVLEALGRLSSDPKVVKMQRVQAELVSDEFANQRSTLDTLDGACVAVCQDLENIQAPPAWIHTVREKNSTLHVKWDELTDTIGKYLVDLSVASSASCEFTVACTQLADRLTHISDTIQELSAQKQNISSSSDAQPADYTQLSQSIDTVVEEMGPALEVEWRRVESLGEHLTCVLEDAAEKREVCERVRQVSRQKQRTRKSLDELLASVRGTLQEIEEFGAVCSEFDGWMDQVYGQAQLERLLISADTRVLAEQVSLFEPTYREVTSREHELILLQHRGSTMPVAASDVGALTTRWSELKSCVLGRHRQLQLCMGLSERYSTVCSEFVPCLETFCARWVAEIGHTVFLKLSMQAHCRDVQAFRHDVAMKSVSFDNYSSATKQFLEATDVDKHGVIESLATNTDKWRHLTDGLHNYQQFAQELSRQVNDVCDSVDELQTSVGACEERVQAIRCTDPKQVLAVEEVRRDVEVCRQRCACVVERVSALVTDTALETTYGIVRGRRVGECEFSLDAGAVCECVEAAEERLARLDVRVQECVKRLCEASQAVAQLSEAVKQIYRRLDQLAAELESMEPIARVVKVVERQIEEVTIFIEHVESEKGEISGTRDTVHSLVQQGVQPDDNAYIDQLNLMDGQLDRLRERGETRKTEASLVLTKLTNFYSMYQLVVEDMDEALVREANFSMPAGDDLREIRSHQTEFKQFRTQHVETLSVRVDDCNQLGHDLIRSVATGVSTVMLEGELESMNTVWTDLQERVQAREQALDLALLKSGKFRETLDALLQWLSETEELVANQKLPSTDHKVVKAQIQEQKFLQRLLSDREEAVASLSQMAFEILRQCRDASERDTIDRSIVQLASRFDTLQIQAQERMQQLESAFSIAKEYQGYSDIIVDWLDMMERKIKDLEPVPSDEEKIQQSLQLHSRLHTDIVAKRDDFNQLADCASRLFDLVAPEDASTLMDRLQTLTDRFAALVTDSERARAALLEACKLLRALVLGYEALVGWMEGAHSSREQSAVLPVYTESLVQHLSAVQHLCEEVKCHHTAVDEIQEVGKELMKYICSDETIQLKEKLENLTDRFHTLDKSVNALLASGQTLEPMVEEFHSTSAAVCDWLVSTEQLLQSSDTSLQCVEGLEQLSAEVSEQTACIEQLGQLVARICQLSVGEGAQFLDTTVTRCRRRHETIAECLRQRIDTARASQQKHLELLRNIEQLLEWFHETKSQLCVLNVFVVAPDTVRSLLADHKTLNDEINSERGRAREAISSAKRRLRHSSTFCDTYSGQIRAKHEELRELVDKVHQLSSQRLGELEQVLPLCEHLFDTNEELCTWLDEVQEQVRRCVTTSACTAEQICRQQGAVRVLYQSFCEHKSSVEKLERVHEALCRVCGGGDSCQYSLLKVEEMVTGVRERYHSLRDMLRSRQQELEQVLQECCQFTDRLDGLVGSLRDTCAQVRRVDPVSVHVQRLRAQLRENQALVEDLAQRQSTVLAVCEAAREFIEKSSGSSDSSIKEIREKLDGLQNMWKYLNEVTEQRNVSLQEMLSVAESFWLEMKAVIDLLRDLQTSLEDQQAPAAEPRCLEEQKHQLDRLGDTVQTARARVESVARAGEHVFELCAEQERPELRQNLNDLQALWQTVTTLFAEREHNIVVAMERSMDFHELLKNLLEFMEQAEKQLLQFGCVACDMPTIRKQMLQLKDFKEWVDPQMVNVDAVNRQAQDLLDVCSPEQASVVNKPIEHLNCRWEELIQCIMQRQQSLDQALLQHGQFQQAYEEIQEWISRTDCVIDSITHRFADFQIIEVELAKLKVAINDIHVHQNSVDSLCDVGRQLINTDTQMSDTMQEKLDSLLESWGRLREKAGDKQIAVEQMLKEVQQFNVDIQELLFWLNDVDNALTTSKPVGGLPASSKEQLDRFMQLYGEIDETAARVNATLTQGEAYVQRGRDGDDTAVAPGTSACANTQHSLRTLRQRWEHVSTRANDKKIKLEIALKEALEFEQLQTQFCAWLKQVEATLDGLCRVSCVLDTVSMQVDEHRELQREIGAHRDTMLALEKRGNQLKYFSQKQDVIVIKNVLVSVQHRWEAVVSKTAERMRVLDTGYKQAQQFHGDWTALCAWLDECLSGLQGSVSAEGCHALSNDPDQVRRLIAAHKQLQRQVLARQGEYEFVLRLGKQLLRQTAAASPSESCERAQCAVSVADDARVVREMLEEAKQRWSALASACVDRQRCLDEGLMLCGQWHESLAALLEWLHTTRRHLDEQLACSVCGDLDTVVALVERHNVVKAEVLQWTTHVHSVRQTGADMQTRASDAEREEIAGRLEEMNTLWAYVTESSSRHAERLEEALEGAERLHKSVHELLEWLSEAELRLRFVASGTSSAEDDRLLAEMSREYDTFRQQLEARRSDKEATLELCAAILARAHPDAVSVIRHWQTVVQARWDEVCSWAEQRGQRLQENALVFEEMRQLYERLMGWIRQQHDTLERLQTQGVAPDGDVHVLERLADEHQAFMVALEAKQVDVDAICRPKTKIASKTIGSTTHLFKDKDFKYRSAGSMIDLIDSDSKWSYIGPIFINTCIYTAIGKKNSRTSNVISEPAMKSPRQRELWALWRCTWVLAFERYKMLMDKIYYVQEMDKLKTFNFEIWRKRFSKHANHHKLRITDLFRRLDADNDGFLSKEEFIDGILKTNFITSRMEMQLVADRVDRNEDGLIDYNEFMSALKPDWDKNRPLTEAEKIDDEVQKACSACTCKNKFKVLQVAAGKYRFGESQKLRLVRILRSTVMVRVGGGWEALDEFLVKNDPCRAKGRTNVELREQFVLAPGVAQTMTPFKSKKRDFSQPSSAGRITPLSNVGPITKIREKTIRSLPLSQTTLSHSSQSASSKRNPTTPTRIPSRTPSELSVDSVENSSRSASRQCYTPLVSRSSSKTKAYSKLSASTSKISTTSSRSSSSSHTGTSMSSIAASNKPLSAKRHSHVITRTPTSVNMRYSNTPSRYNIRREKSSNDL